MSPFSESSKATSRELGACHWVSTGISSPHTTCWVHSHLLDRQVETTQTAHRNTICSERQTVPQGNCQNKNNGQNMQPSVTKQSSQRNQWSFRLNMRGKPSSLQLQCNPSALLSNQDCYICKCWYPVSFHL